MPQLIAMVIVVAGAMIYMFQTFGGTGNKIEGVAQRPSIIAEIHNIRDGVRYASQAGDISNASGSVTNMKSLAELEYFVAQINTNVKDNTTAGNVNEGVNTYSAISFGGESNPGLLINLVVGNDGTRPGIRVQFVGGLNANKGYLENQISTDLGNIASIDRISEINSAAVTLDANGDVPSANTPAGVTDANRSKLTDGIFTIYFKDMPANIQ